MASIRATDENETGTVLFGRRKQMKKHGPINRCGIHSKWKRLFRHSPAALGMGIAWARPARIILSVLLALLVIAGIYVPVRFAGSRMPQAQNGVLNLADWNGKQPFAVNGQWEFYWDQLLSNALCEPSVYLRKDSEQKASFAAVPGKWNNYHINGEALPGKGKATYRLQVTGAEAGTQYGVRIQRAASVYRVIADGVLIAQNGSFGDNETAPASDYPPTLAAFTPAGSSFDLVIQVSNDIYGFGGLWDAVIFGTYPQVSSFDRKLSNTVIAAMSCLLSSCVFFLIFFTAQRGEKDALILFLLGILVLLRFSLEGDVVFAGLFPQAPIIYMDWIDFLTMPWAQFLLLYFIHCTYGRLVPKWQVYVVLGYTAGITAFILLFPLELVTGVYVLMNYVLLAVMLTVTGQLVRAAWQGREGASLLLFAMLLILGLVFYEMFLPDHSAGYVLLSAAGIQYLMFVFAQMAVVAMRYRRAHELEIAHLKGQIRPHFIHNALTSIISISRREPDRARELLVDFSSYLRGFYDYERDELVPFVQEQELVRAYATLEQARFGGKFRVEYQIEAEDFLLPSLILQPLVENAFIHGLREKEEGGTVTVYSRRMKDNRIRIGVRDDGIGFSEKSSSSRKGVGIQNINRRLSRLYRTSLVFELPQGGGCEVYFEIPCKEVKLHEDMAD
jgi:two-component system LytT family sensor kinase